MGSIGQKEEVEFNSYLRLSLPGDVHVGEGYDLGMNGPCLETGYSLSVLKNVILHEWENLVRAQIISTESASSIVLRNHVPKILDQLEQILLSGTLDETELGKEHGYYRSALTRFTVRDVLTEYSILREVIVNYLYPMKSRECTLLVHKFLDIITKHSVVEMINHQVVHNKIAIEQMGDEVEEIKENPIIPTASY